jgi:hypothetical protein
MDAQILIYYDFLRQIHISFNAASFWYNCNYLNLLKFFRQEQYPVTPEVASSSLVVPATNIKDLDESSESFFLFQRAGKRQNPPNPHLVNTPRPKGGAS